MPVVSDFSVILDGTKTIGDSNTNWEANFNTGGRNANSVAVLSYMVKGMTIANTSAKIFINNKHIGNVMRAKGAKPEHWFSQSHVFDSDCLKNGDNEIRIGAVNNPNHGDDHFDDFSIRSMIVTFKQTV